MVENMDRAATGKKKQSTMFDDGLVTVNNNQPIRDIIQRVAAGDDASTGMHQE